MEPRTVWTTSSAVDLGVALFIPYRHMEDRIFRALEDAGFNYWTPAQLRICNASPRTVASHRLAEQAQLLKAEAPGSWSINWNFWLCPPCPPTRLRRAPMLVVFFEERGHEPAEVAIATILQDPASGRPISLPLNFHSVATDPGSLLEITDPYAHNRVGRRSVAPSSACRQIFQPQQAPSVGFTPHLEY